MSGQKQTSKAEEPSHGLFKFFNKTKTTPKEPAHPRVTVSVAQGAIAGPSSALAPAAAGSSEGGAGPSMALAIEAAGAPEIPKDKQTQRKVTVAAVNVGASTSSQEAGPSVPPGGVRPRQATSIEIAGLSMKDLEHALDLQKINVHRHPTDYHFQPEECCYMTFDPTIRRVDYPRVNLDCFPALGRVRVSLHVVAATLDYKRKHGDNNELVELLRETQDGPSSQTMEASHLCRAVQAAGTVSENHSCFNPAHVVYESHEDNVSRIGCTLFRDFSEEEKMEYSAAMLAWAAHYTCPHRPQCIVVPPVPTPSPIENRLVPRVGEMGTVVSAVEWLLRPLSTGDGLTLSRVDREFRWRDAGLEGRDISWRKAEPKGCPWDYYSRLWTEIVDVKRKAQAGQLEGMGTIELSDIDAAEYLDGRRVSSGKTLFQYIVSLPKPDIYTEMYTECVNEMNANGRGGAVPYEGKLAGYFEKKVARRIQKLRGKLSKKHATWNADHDLFVSFFPNVDTVTLGFPPRAPPT